MDRQKNASKKAMITGDFCEIFSRQNLSEIRTQTMLIEELKRHNFMIS